MQKLIIGEMGETACIVSKSVVIARYEVMAWYIAVTALVESLKAEEASRGRHRRDGALTLPVYSRSVVSVAGYGTFPDVVIVGDGFMMEVATC